MNILDFTNVPNLYEHTRHPYNVNLSINDLFRMNMDGACADMTVAVQVGEYPRKLCSCHYLEYFIVKLCYRKRTEINISKYLRKVFSMCSRSMKMIFFFFLNEAKMCDLVTIGNIKRV